MRALLPHTWRIALVSYKSPRSCSARLLLNAQRLADLTAPAALGVPGGVRLSGGFPADAVRLQVFEASSNSLAAAQKLAAELTALPWDRTGLTAGETRWYWFRAVSAEGNVSALAEPASATAG